MNGAQASMFDDTMEQSIFDEVKTWVFDLDGTLVEAMPLQHIIREVARMGGHSFPSLFHEYRTNFQGVEAMRNFHKTLVADDERASVDALYEEWEASQRAPDLQEGVVELLDALKKRGRRLVLWSKGYAEQQERKLRVVGLHDYFDERLVTTQKGRREAVEQKLIPAVTGAWAMVGDSYEQDVVPALPYARIVYWIYGGWANSLAAPESWESHHRMRRIGHIRELGAAMRRHGGGV